MGLDSDFLVTGDGTGSTGTTILGTGAGAGAGTLAVAVLVGAGAGVEGGGTPDEIAPVSRLTRFGGAVLPEKNSPAERAGSEDGAGG